MRPRLRALLAAPLFVLLPLGILACSENKDEVAPNILFILVDTLRADHLGTYGYERDTSPTIDALAARGIVFTEARSVSNWTNPTIQSLFLGRSPLSLMKESLHREAIRIPLAAGLPTLAEQVADAGYRTSALVDHPGIGPGLGFDRGFERFVRLFQQGSERGRGWGKSNIWYVQHEFEQILDEPDPRPFFTYLHVVYPHHPYAAPARYRGMFGDDDFGKGKIKVARKDQLIRAYDTQIRRTDDLIAMILEDLERRGQLDNTWILITADHGEELFDHGNVGHGRHFFDSITRVPLILVPPAGTSLDVDRIETPVSNLDLHSTVLAIAKADRPPDTEGISLIGRELEGRRASVRPQIITNPHGLDAEGMAVVSEGWKLIRQSNRVQGPKLQLFDLENDPGEVDDLREGHADHQQRLKDFLDAHRRRSLVQLAEREQTLSNPDEETIEALRTMGYIQ